MLRRPSSAVVIVWLIVLTFTSGLEARAGQGGLCAGIPARVGTIIGNMHDPKTGTNQIARVQAALFLIDISRDSAIVGWVLIDEFGIQSVVLNEKGDKRTAQWFHIPYGKLPYDSSGGSYSFMYVQPRFSLPTWLHVRACSK